MNEPQLKYNLLSYQQYSAYDTAEKKIVTNYLPMFQSLQIRMLQIMCIELLKRPPGNFSAFVTFE